MILPNGPESFTMLPRLSMVARRTTAWQRLANVSAGVSGIAFVVSLWVMVDGHLWPGRALVAASFLIFLVALFAARRAERAEGGTYEVTDIGAKDQPWVLERRDDDGGRS